MAVLAGSAPEEGVRGRHPSGKITIYWALFLTSTRCREYCVAKLGFLRCLKSAPPEGQSGVPNKRRFCVCRGEAEVTAAA